MKLSFSAAAIAKAPAEYVRVRLTEGKVNRVVKDGEAEWLELGVGKFAEVGRRKFLLVCRSIVQMAKAHGMRNVALQVGDRPFTQLAKIPLKEVGELMAVNFEMANFEFVSYKTPPEDGHAFVEEILICGASKDMQAGFTKGHIIGAGVNLARELANTPGGDLTPTMLAEEARKAANGLPVHVSVLNRAAIEQEGMGAIGGVAKGSAEEPRFIVMEYAGAKGRPIVLVGKGVTFDSGGLNIKTGDHMYEMHMDMSGGAAAIAACVIAARLKLKKRVIAIVPAVENMSAADAMRPGDILKTLSGKTVEVANTDAEGRLILADALTYAKRFKPAAVLDAATLTGSSIRGLGLRVNALLSRDDALAKVVERAGEESGDYVWRLPLWEEYEENIKSDFADFTNAPSGSAGQGDVINAATFLYQFAKDIGAPWAHIDIAPRMTAIPSDKLAKGAAGEPVRLFVRFIEDFT